MNKNNLVEQCIKNYRGSISNNRITVEGICTPLPLDHDFIQGLS